MTLQSLTNASDIRYAIVLDFLIEGIFRPARSSCLVGAPPVAVGTGGDTFTQPAM